MYFLARHIVAYLAWLLIVFLSTAPRCLFSTDIDNGYKYKHGHGHEYISQIGARARSIIHDRQNIKGFIKFMIPFLFAYFSEELIFICLYYFCTVSGK